ncbi:hypothetical protein JZM21_29890, partial [Escherichia coli]|uniref:hypothetical protein n=1 Tax=Escherichia coli TaxID=562 RepID=UPI0019D11C68
HPGLCWEIPRINMGNSPNFYGKCHELVWETPRIAMGNALGLNSCFMTVDNTLISLVGWAFA